MIDMKKIFDVFRLYKDQYPGLDIHFWEDYCCDLDIPVIMWSIEAKLDAIAFGAHEYFTRGCTGCDTDEVIKRLTDDIMYFLSKEKVKHIIDQNKFERG